MERLIWDEGFSLGDIEMDKDHRDIFDFYNRACEASEKGLPMDIVKANFYRRISEHFSREEQYIKQKSVDTETLQIYQKSREDFFEAVKQFSEITSPEFLNFLRIYLKAHLIDHGKINIREWKNA